MKQSSVEMASESEQAKRGTPSSFLRVAGSIRGLVTVAAEHLASEDLLPPCPDKSGRIGTRAAGCAGDGQVAAPSELGGGGACSPARRQIGVL